MINGLGAIVTAETGKSIVEAFSSVVTGEMAGLIAIAAGVGGLTWAIRKVFKTIPR